MSANLVPTWQIGNIHLTEYPYSVSREDDVEIGEPEMEVESLTSMLADSDLERVVRHGNRSYVIPCYVEGADLAAVADAETALRSELTRQGLVLIHDPGDGFAPASAYNVLTVQMTPERNDTHNSHLMHKWTLTLTCEAFARSVELTTVEALTIVGAPTVVTIDSCNSVTGWTGSRSGAGSPALGIWGGSVGVVDLDSAVTSPEVWTLTRTGAIDFSATEYLVVEARTVSPISDYVTAYPNASGAGESLALISMRRIDAIEGWYEFTYRANVGTISALTLTHTSSPGEDWQGLVVRAVSRTNQPPGQTSRQLTRIIETGGTERTPASIQVSSADGVTPVGATMIHTSPEDGSGYSPPLQRWRTAGQAQTADPTTYSGTYELITGPSWAAEVPTSALPEGGYILMARLRANLAGIHPISWSTSTIFPDTTTQQGFTLGLVNWNFGAAGAWNLVPLAALTLPSVRTSAGKVQIAIQRQADPITSDEHVTLDEAWLFRADDDCALTILETGHPNIWLDSPDVSSSVPRVWVGGDRATQTHPGEGLYAMGTHVLHPNGTSIFTASSATYPLASATYYKRWHSNAAE